MTQLKRVDIIKYLIKIQLNFENSYVTATELERELLLESWFEALCEYPKEACDAAVNNVLKHSKFAPRLGEICEEAEKLLNPDKKSDEELWAELEGVLAQVYDISRYLSYPQNFKSASDKLKIIYGELDEDIKLYVVNTSTLVHISELTSESLLYERNRFLKQMPVLKKHKKEKRAAQKFLNAVNAAALPEGKNLIDKNKK